MTDDVLLKLAQTYTDAKVRMEKGVGKEGASIAEFQWLRRP